MKRIKFAPVKTQIMATREGLRKYLSLELRHSEYSVERTLRHYDTIIRRYGPITMDPGYAHHVEEDLRSRGCSPNYIRLLLHTIEYAVWSSGVSRMEYHLSKPRPPEHKAAYYTVEEARRLLDACQTIQERAILSYALYTAARCREIIEARVGDVDLKNRWILVRSRKRGREDIIPMAPPLKPVLEEWLRNRPQVPTDHLFITVDGRKFTQRGLEEVVYRLKRRACIKKPGCLHVLRHTALNLLAMSGTPETLLMLYSGHRNRRSLDRYLHPCATDLRRYIDKYLVY